MDLNRATLIGNLTRDPEVRTTASGQNVASFGLATNRVWTNQNGEKQESAEFHNLVAWGKLGDTCAKYLKRGSKIYAEGRIQTRSWDDPSGQKRYRTEIVLDSMIMLDRRLTVSDDISQAPSQDSEADAVSQASAEQEIKVEDIPF